MKDEVRKLMIDEYKLAKQQEKMSELMKRPCKAASKLLKAAVISSRQRLKK
jgi:hypothetical protein